MKRRNRREGRPLLDPLYPHTERVKNISMGIDRKHMMFTTGYTPMLLRRMSRDNPEWMQTTIHYYRKQDHNTPDTPPNHTYDIFNHKKSVVVGRNEDYYYGLMGKSVIGETAMRSVKWDVTQKVGSCEKRDFSVKKPLLKIGNNNFYVNTYSPF